MNDQNILGSSIFVINLDTGDTSEVGKNKNHHSNNFSPYKKVTSLHAKSFMKAKKTFLLGQSNVFTSEIGKKMEHENMILD